MRRRRKSPEPPKSRRPWSNDQGLPPLGILENFTHSTLVRWREAGRNLERFSEKLFFGLEEYRSRYSAELIDAIRASTTGPHEYSGWSRLVDYRYANQPLSMAGSTRGDGGRFNIGVTLNPATCTPFPSLYVAEDFPTAFRERFGALPDASGGALTTAELALRRESSFSQVALNVRLESVMDVGDISKLKSVAEILARIQMPSGIGNLARLLRLRMPGLVRSASGLRRQLLHPEWRVYPVQYDLPSNSQVFGRWCLAAGVHGILYPSVRNSDRRCLALFPQNWAGSSSFVELVGPCPTEVATTRLDGSTQYS